MKIALLGDIAPIGSFDIEKNPEVLKGLEEVSSFLEDYDYVVANLETPFSVRKKTYGAKSAWISTMPPNIELLKKLHINIVCLANNHIYDYGKEGYELTKRILAENDIKYFGIEGKNVMVSEPGTNTCIAFEGFCCYSTNPLNTVEYGRLGINEFDISTVNDILIRNKGERLFTILSVHAGVEHVNYPSLDNIKAARLFAENGPYVYYGHHPHVLQGTECYKKSYIYHSLGNFIFDDVYAGREEPLITLSRNNRESMIVSLDIEDNEVLASGIFPVSIGKGKLTFLPQDDALLEKYDFQKAITNSEEYASSRQKQISAYLLNRKKKRNLNWYLVRLRCRYARILFNARINSRKYREKVHDLL